MEYQLSPELIVGLSPVTDFLRNFITTETFHEHMLIPENTNDTMLESLEDSLLRYRSCIGLDNVYIAYARRIDHNEPIMTMIVYFDPNMIGRMDNSNQLFQMQYHIGIHRNVRHIYSKINTIGNISINLQKVACWGINRIFGVNPNRFVVVNPLYRMEQILNDFLNDSFYHAESVEYDNYDIIYVSLNENEEVYYIIPDNLRKCIYGAHIAFESSKFIGPQ